jgi:imidazolonepropionase-like amidohydrolase
VLIVKGDPLQDLTVLSNVQYVIHNGEVIRDDIDSAVNQGYNCNK